MEGKYVTGSNSTFLLSLSCGREIEGKPYRSKMTKRELRDFNTDQRLGVAGRQQRVKRVSARVKVNNLAAGVEHASS